MRDAHPHAEPVNNADRLVNREPEYKSDLHMTGIFG